MSRLNVTINRQMQEVHDRAVASTKAKMQNQFKELLGIPS